MLKRSTILVYLIQTNCYTQLIQTPRPTLHPSPHLLPDMVVISVERGPHMREIRTLVPGRVKPMIYKMDTCHFLAWRLALIE